MSRQLNYSERYEKLDQFFGAFFNQFWKTTTPFDGPPTDRGVVAYAAKLHTSLELRDVRTQLRAFLSESLDDVTLSDILLHDLGSFYNPAPQGLTKRQWLWKIDEYLTEELQKIGTV